MTEARRTNWPRILTQALVAGVAGGAVLDLYLYLSFVLPSHASMLQHWQWVASAAIGSVATSNVAYAYLGLAVHLVVSCAWAGGYAYLAGAQAFMNRRWAISGIVYGFVVYVFMQLVLLGSGKFQFPTSFASLFEAIAAHCIFFGLPVAIIVAKMGQTD